MVQGCPRIGFPPRIWPVSAKTCDLFGRFSCEFSLNVLRHQSFNLLKDRPAFLQSPCWEDWGTHTPSRQSRLQSRKDLPLHIHAPFLKKTEAKQHITLCGGIYGRWVWPMWKILNGQIVTAPPVSHLGSPQGDFKIWGGVFGWGNQISMTKSMPVCHHNLAFICPGPSFLSKIPLGDHCLNQNCQIHGLKVSQTGKFSELFLFHPFGTGGFGDYICVVLHKIFVHRFVSEKKILFKIYPTADSGCPRIIPPGLLFGGLWEKVILSIHIIICFQMRM